MTTIDQAEIKKSINEKVSKQKNGIIIITFFHYHYNNFVLSDRRPTPYEIWKEKNKPEVIKKNGASKLNHQQW